ncbi:unnamed protein product [Rotaria sp. Silwood2]|nr:unnamed protein product [Rotaria sp. Silwood2]CAF4704170.1 unnamed protein product [Rotaria sp. Silwood2]
MYELDRYQHPINLDGQCLSLSLFLNKKDFIGKIVTITSSDKNEEQVQVDDENIISKHTQHVYVRRKEEIFVKIINICDDSKVTVTVINNPLSNSNSNVPFFLHDTKSTPYFVHSKYIKKMINDNITMDCDLISYFTQTNYSDEDKKYENDDKIWIDELLLSRINKNPTEHDLNALNCLLNKNILCQDLYNKYINDYIPLNNIYQIIVGILSAREYMEYETNPYYPQFDRYDDCISTCYSSYGYNNNNTESRYLKNGDIIHINLENIHYLPLDLNHMNDFQKYTYKFRKIPKPMSWSGTLFEDGDAVLSSLQVGNTVRCCLEKILIDGNQVDNGGGAWYFNIIQIIDNIVYGILEDPYYNPKDYNLNQGDILVFNKDNISEIPHTWKSNSNLQHFTVLDVGYAPTGYIRELDTDVQENSSTNE